MKLIFKVDLQPILDESGQFEFFLLTGIGQRKKDTIGVEKADVKDLPSTIQALTKIFKEDNIKLGRTVDDKGILKDNLGNMTRKTERLQSYSIQSIMEQNLY